MACTRDGGTRSGVYRTRSVEARRHAGRHCGTRSPSGEGAKSTTMGRSMRRSSAVAPTSPPIARTPSSYPVLLVECEEGVRTIGGLVGATAGDLRMDLPMLVDVAPWAELDLCPQMRRALR